MRYFIINFVLRGRNTTQLSYVPVTTYNDGTPDMDYIRTHLNEVNKDPKVIIVGIPIEVSEEEYTRLNIQP